jgi:hypothetical protein
MLFVTTLVSLMLSATNITSIQPDLETGFQTPPFSGFSESSFCTTTLQYPAPKCPGQTDVNPDAPKDKEPADNDYSPDIAETILYY